MTKRRVSPAAIRSTATTPPTHNAPPRHVERRPQGGVAGKAAVETGAEIEAVRAAAVGIRRAADEAGRRRLVSACSLCVRRMSRTALLGKYLLSLESIVGRYRWPSASDKSTSSTDERPSRRLSNR